MFNKHLRLAWASLLNVAVTTAFVASLVFAALPVTTVQAAAVITVTTTQDVFNTDGKCSLREAIISADKDKAPNTGKGECTAGNRDDTIVLAAGTYFLTRTDNGNENSSATGDLDVTANVTVQGTGADKVVIDGTALTDRIFQVFAAKLTLTGVTLKGGKSRDAGGAIHSNGPIFIQNSAVTGAAAGTDGGGVYLTAPGTLTILNSTISGNQAVNQGGGLFNAGGSVNITNSTFSDNSAGGSGGGLWNDGTLSLLNVTVSRNTADQNADSVGVGGGLFHSTGNTTLKNTLLAGNLVLSVFPTSLECAGTLTSAGHNLVQNPAGCSLTGPATGDLFGVDPLLAPLANNGGTTLTHALLPLSPAVDAGDNSGCPAADQRGLPRPVGASCDIGAVEEQAPLQRSPYVVNAGGDGNDGRCDFLNCTLREAVVAANGAANGAVPDRIHFNLPGTGPFVLGLTSALPTLSDPVIVDGTTQSGFSGTPLIVLQGSQAGSTVNGLTLATNASQINSLAITGFGSSGIVVSSGQGNSFLGNQIFDNGGLGIDLAGDGVTVNDVGDADTGSNQLQNFPVVSRVVPGTTSAAFDGRINAQPNQVYRIELFSNPVCDASNFGEGQSLLGGFDLTTDAQGNALFSQVLPASLQANAFITATATAPDGSTSEFSPCVTASPGNDSWTSAFVLTPNPLTGQPASASQFLDLKGQSRWYKFSVNPESRVTVTLTNLPDNFDLTLYKDIDQAFQTLTTPADLMRLGAEFAPDAFSPDAFSPDAFSPDAFSPDAFSPDAFSPDAFSPDAFSPDAFSPDAFSPDAFSPDAFSPDAFSPDAFSPDAFSPDAFSPDAFSPDAFSGAQSRSLLAVSAFEGTTSEGIRVNTWDQTGEFYLRVRGRNGNFNLTSPYQLSVSLTSNICLNVGPIATAATLNPVAGDYQTIILTNLSRMAGSAEEKAALAQQLAQLAGRAEVNGVVVNVADDARVAAAYAQADANPACPAAQNILADTIKEIITRYRSGNALQYVVLVGGDNVIPYFRHADGAMLGNEKNFVPPVLENTPSQASLKSGYFLSQDDYGAAFTISVKGDDLPMLDLAVGRLVETAAEAKTVVDAYLGTADGTLPAPNSLLVTGYDFLTDGAEAVLSQLEAGSAVIADTLIQPRGDPPTAASAWTASQLGSALLGARHDLVFLAGHFSASSALAADYTTRLTTAELVASLTDFTNAIVFSPGCHAGYNLVDEHAVPNVTPQPDWASAFAQKGATLIAGTGYQYGDTDFIEYSERLYLEFSRQLRTGQGAVPVGVALMHAKQIYLADTTVLRPIHQKALLEATLFGLPMLSVNMAGERLTQPGDPPIVTSSTPAASNPGAALGLSSADLTIQPALTTQTVLLESVSQTDSVLATYLSGGSGLLTNPAEPVLPLERRNVSLAGTVLRGVGFRGGLYTDRENILPLTGASTTEIRGIHPPFATNVYFPVQPWSLNYFGQLANNSSGSTQLQAIPAQFISDPASLTTGELRQYDRMDFRLFYNNNIQTYAGNSIPALAAAPSILNVAALGTSSQVDFTATVLANPSVGIQSVWVTYTALNGPLYGQWQSLDLLQDPADSTRWSASLPLSVTAPTDIRYIVQAVNGVGLVSLSTNIGRYFIPNLVDGPSQATQLTLTAPASGVYGSPVNLSAMLTSAGQPLSGQPVSLRVGNQSRVGFTGADGSVTLSIALLGLPGQNLATASFAGSSTYLSSSASALVGISKAGTQVTLTPAEFTGRPGESNLVTAVLSSGARRLLEKTLFFVLESAAGTYTFPVITDYSGRASLDTATLPAGVYTLTVYFVGDVPLNGQLVTLVDERYLASSAAGTVMIDDIPQAMDDAFSLSLNTVLNVPAPGVLANDLDSESSPLSAVLVTGASNGVVQLNADGSFSYTPNADFLGSDSFSYTANDALGASAPATVTLTVVNVNQAPVCSTAVSSNTFIWPSNKNFVTVSVMNVFDPDGDTFIIRIDRIFQDELVGQVADGAGIGTSEAQIRAERDGNGNGRVYHIYFTATDNFGASCSGELLVPVVDHDMGNGVGAIDDGSLYDSTIPTK
ncbi:MAG TPA: choice-of-anchor Q domain-containing protein [Bellilinea sp.]|nr:choice-of-anchor Q domain-containing protein [Bellilinea sp.]